MDGRTCWHCIRSRRGLRRVKHIDTVFLWVQALVTEGRVTLGKKPSKEILADYLNKYVDAATMLTCLSGLGMKLQSGESRLTLRAGSADGRYFSSTS